MSSNRRLCLHPPSCQRAAERRSYPLPASMIEPVTGWRFRPKWGNKPAIVLIVATWSYHRSRVCCSSQLSLAAAVLNSPRSAGLFAAADGDLLAVIISNDAAVAIALAANARPARRACCVAKSVRHALPVSFSWKPWRRNKCHQLAFRRSNLNSWTTW